MDIYKEMTIVIDGVTFSKVIGDFNIYAEQYGVFIPNSAAINTFDEMIDVASKWLETQD